MAFGGRMSAPVCLIEDDQSGKLCVRKEARDILDAINEPVVVVSVVGLYRTGKSYLMNRLAGQQSGFALGSTIESKTKGIWMWCVPHPCKTGHTLVLLDTEGLGDVKKGDEKHDTWIFCLAVLLSSTLVYNSLGVIDNMALEKLHYITELTENIRVKAGGSPDEEQSDDFMRVFPSFVWAVRDFTLELKLGDEHITSDAYLESALVLKKGSSAEKYNLPRRCLRHFFAVRKCFVFPRPADTQKMKRMEELTESELDSEFLEQANTFCQYIYSNSDAKTITGGQTITGAALGNLAEVYVEAIGSGKIPCLENAVVSLSKIQNVRAVDQALQHYLTEMLNYATFPLNPKELSDLHTFIEKKAIEVFISTCFGDNDQKYQRELMGKIYDEYQHLCQQNNEVSLTQCEEELRKVFSKMEKHISRGSYLRPGGYQEYRASLANITSEYRERTKSQIMSEEVLSKFLKAQEDVGNMILQADQSLSKAEQEREAQILKNETLKQRQRGLEEQNRLQQQAFKDMERTHKEHVNQVIHQMEREQERMMKDNERVLEAKLREKDAVMKQGLDEQALKLQRQINNLQDEIIKAKNSQPSKVERVVDGISAAAELVLPGFVPKLISSGISAVVKWFK
ncbi:hypothetical protein DNTS_024315 [Danionella cerebrum]|uniref:GB1/RHD3-type G domain-containing protein n=1 Tax=Danionella cerebrum TaxID=2873325 RepID=A0A553NLL4_9TELE|nr:hypothetical protein DNTS_024315 [Danionella translucida]